MANAADLPSPAPLLEALNGFQRTGALKAAIELDLFTAIGRGVDKAKELAEELGASERGVRILCDYLTVLGFLVKREERYCLAAAVAPFVDRRSDLFMADAVGFLANRQLVEAFMDVASAVRKGGSVSEGEGSLAPEHPMWVEYARAMSRTAALSARLLCDLLALDPSQPCKVLDIAAGHGMFGITIARANPRAEIVALDWPNVLDLARANARAAGVEERYRTIAGSALTAEFEGGYDLVLLTNFLHHFDRQTCTTLAAKVHGALKPAGRAVVLDFMPNADRVSPPQPAAFALVMLVTTPAGDAYTLAEFEEMFEEAGFAEITRHGLAPSPQSVLIARK